MRAAWLRVAAKDARIELRARETLLPVLLTALLVVLTGVLALHDVHDRAVVASGVLWMGLAFAAATGLARAFGAERDHGTLDLLLALPAARGSVYVGKTAASFALLLVVALLVLPIYALVSGDPVPDAWPGLLLLVTLGSLGLAATGTMLSLLVAQARTRDLLLPALLLPLAVPVLIAATHGTHDLLAGEAFEAWRPELLLLAGYDLAFLAAGTLLVEQAA